MAQGRGDTGNRRLDVGGPAESKGTFEHQGRAVEGSLQQGRIADTVIHLLQGKGVINRLGNPDTFICKGYAFGELAHLRQAVDQPLIGANGGNHRPAEALISEIVWEECDDLPEKLYGLRIVAQGAMCFAQDEIRCELEEHIAEVAGDG